MTLRDYAYYATTRGMCRTCRRIVTARIVERDGAIVQQNLCERCGTSEALIAEGADWYFEALGFPARSGRPPKTQTRVSEGCPHDCGLCEFHETAPVLPVFSITNACNLACPICFTYNRDDRAWHMGEAEMKRTVDFLLNQRERYDLINLTGGEPTLHPGLPGLIALAKSDRIGRVTVNSNGLKLAHDETLLDQLAALGVYVILSFDTLVPETSVRIHGRDIVEEKKKALANLERKGIGATLLNVMIGGVNDREIAGVIDLAVAHRNVRSVTVQTMTFTGSGGGQFEPRVRITLDGAARIMEETTGGRVKRAHFFPLSATHPLCYSVAYYFRDGENLHSFTDLLPREQLAELLGDHYLLHPDERFHETMNEAIAARWAETGDTPLLRALKALVKRLYPAGGDLTPFERQRIGEESILTIYVHAHMDEDTFDVSRIACCTDLVPVDGERLIPACAYNLFYRMKDERVFTAVDR